MLLRLFKNNRAGGIAFILVLLILMWSGSFFRPPEIVHWTTMPLYDLLFQPLEKNPFFSSLVALLLYGIIAILLVRINVRFTLIQERTFMPAIFFLLIGGSYPPLQQVNPFLVGAIFLLLSIMVLFHAMDDKPDSYRVFNSSILLGLGSLFYLKMIWFIPLIWITISIIRPLRWREFVYPVVVFLLIGLFYFTWFWVFRNNASLFGEMLEHNLAFNTRPHSFITPLFYVMGYLLFLIFLSSVFLVSRFQVRKIIIRKLYQVFFFMFLYTIIFFIVVAGLHPEMLCLIAIPVSSVYISLGEKVPIPPVFGPCSWSYIFL